ncbi:MAG TPA: hypothetical protein DFR83_00015 [Deltaproteobacteria bacterium]|nr:hypothetical protein [Deltaproteobacteria bacterium]
MAGWRDDVRRDYDDLKDRFRSTDRAAFESGDWFAHFVQWMLENYAKTLDADYLKRMYPGVSPANQAKKAIGIAAKYNGVAGGAAAAAVTALELSSLGPQAMVTVPAIGTAIMADVAYSTRTQLRSTYDLSVIHGAPLAIDDVEDCYFVFLTAMGVKLHEMAGGFGKAVGPQVIAYNVRKLLRAGLRKSLQEVLKKVGGTQLAKKLTERAAMRLLVPGIGIPVAYGFNFYFTKSVLGVANLQMRRRGKVVQPLIRLYKREKELARTAALKALIAVVDAGEPDGWSDGQMNALRHCQSTLSLSDEDLTELDEYFDREIQAVIGELPQMHPKAWDDLVQLCLVTASFASNDRHDDAYAAALATLSRRASKPLSEKQAKKAVMKSRKTLK